MIAFILQLLIVFSLGVALYLIARALPRVSDQDVSGDHSGKTYHWFMDRFEVLDERLLSFLEKLIRRIRVIIFHADNTLMRKLSRFKRDNGRETGFPIETETKISNEENKDISAK